MYRPNSSEGFKYLCFISLLFLSQLGAVTGQCGGRKFGDQCQFPCSCAWDGTDRCDGTTGQCICKRGFAGRMCQRDINECRFNPCSSRNGVCKNTRGNYTCECRVGSKVSPISGRCLPCSGETYGSGCSKKCGCHKVNTILCNSIDGSCYCDKGWRGRYCNKNVDDCASKPCGHLKCVDKNKGYVCVCPPNSRKTLSSCQSYKVDLIALNTEPAVGEIVDIFVMYKLPSVYLKSKNSAPDFGYLLRNDQDDISSCMSRFYKSGEQIRGTEWFVEKLKSTFKNKELDYNFYSHYKMRFSKAKLTKITGEPLSHDLQPLSLVLDIRYKNENVDNCLSKMTVPGTKQAPLEINLGPAGLDLKKFQYKRQSYNQFEIKFNSNSKCQESPETIWSFYKFRKDVENADSRNCFEAANIEKIDLNDLVTKSGEEFVNDEHNNVLEVIPRNTLPLGVIYVCPMSFVKDLSASFVYCGYIKVVPSLVISGNIIPHADEIMWSSTRDFVFVADFFEPDLNLELSYSWTCRSSSNKCLHSTERNYVLSASRFISSSSIDFLLTVEVRIKDYPKVTTSQEVFLTKHQNNKGLYVDFRCRKSCERKFGKGRSLFIEAVVDRGDGPLNSKIQMAWNLVRDNNPLSSSELNNLLVGSGEHTLDSFENVSAFRTKPNSLKPGSSYELFLRCYELNTGRSCSMSYKFFIAADPTGKGCQINPQQGQSVLTEFKINCMSYTDPTNNLPLTYTLYQLVQDSKTGKTHNLILAYSYLPVLSRLRLATNSTSGVTLDLKVVISNTLAANTEVAIKVQIGATNTKQIGLKINELFSKKGRRSQDFIRLMETALTIINVQSKSMGKEKAQIRQKVLSYLNDIPIQSPNKLEQITTTLEKAMSESSQVDRGGMNNALKTIDRLTKALEQLSEEQPEIIKSIATSHVSTLDALLGLMIDFSKTIIDKIRKKIRERKQAAKSFSSVGGTLQISGSDEDQQVDMLLSLVKSQGMAVDRSVTQISRALKSNLQADDTQIRITNNNIDLGVERHVINEMSSLKFDSKRVNFNLPTLSMGSKRSDTIDSEFEVFDKNPYLFASRDIHGEMPVVKISLERTAEDKKAKAQYLNEKNWIFSEPADILLQYSETGVEPAVYPAITYVDKKTRQIIQTSCVFMSIRASSLVGTLIRIRSPHKLSVLAKALYTNNIEELDKFSDYEMLELPFVEGNTVKVSGVNLGRGDDLFFLPQLSKRTLNKRKPFFRVKITFKRNQVFKNLQNLQPLGEKERNLLNDPLLDNPDILVYNLSIEIAPCQVSCVHFDRKSSTFKSESCTFSKFSKLDLLHCRCILAAAISGNVFVAPELISPLDIALFLNIFQNPLVVSLVITTWISTLAIGLWGRRKDQEDEIKAGVTILENNLETENYVYLMCVITGWSLQASTTSNVFMYLKGNLGHSSSQRLYDTTRALFQPGATNWFILTTEKDLGELSSLVIWTDFSGANPSWFLNSIYVENLQTKEIWIFPYEGWLIAKLGSKELVTEIPPRKEDYYNQSLVKRLTTRGVADLRNDHLWVGLFAKTANNKFTRVHRLMTAVTMLQSLMLINLVFHGVRKKDDASQYLDVYGYDLHVTSLVVGIQASLIISLIGFGLAFLFNRISPKPKPTTNKQRKEEDIERIKKFGKSHKYTYQRYAYMYDPSECEKLLTAGKVEECKTVEDWIQAPNAYHFKKTSAIKFPINIFSNFVSSFTEKRKSITIENDQNFSHNLRGTFDNEEPQNKKTNFETSEREDLQVVSAGYFNTDANGGEEDDAVGDLNAEPKPTIAPPSKKKKISMKDKPELRIFKAFHALTRGISMEQTTAQEQQIQPDSDGDQVLVLKTEETNPGKVDENGKGEEDEEKEKLKKMTQRFMFPWWFIYVSWFLIGVYNGFLAYYVMLYGLYLGYEKSLDWMMSFFTGFMFNICVIQPTKVIVVVLIVVLIFKQIYSLKEQAPLRKLYDSQMLLQSKQQLNRKYLLKKETQRTASLPPTGNQSAIQILKRLVTQMKAREMVRDMFLYTVFTIAVIVMVFGHFDVNARDRQNNHCENEIFGKYENEKKEYFDRAKDVQEVWRYLIDDFLPKMEKNVDGSTRITDYFLIGPARLRQARIKPNVYECSDISLLSWKIYLRETCSETVDDGVEETRSFNGSWLTLSSLKKSKINDSPYVYRTPEELDTDSFVGKRGVYSGGGFVVTFLQDNIGGSQGQLETLSGANWVDYLTRCLFLEFTLFNPNSLMFTYVSIAFEMAPDGAVILTSKTESSQLFYYRDDTKDRVQIAEIVVIICVFFYTGVEINSLYNNGFKKYFTNIWIWVEILFLLMCYTTLLLLFARSVVFDKVKRKIDFLSGSEFINFQGVFDVDRDLQTCIALLAFLNIFKLLKIFSFNPFTGSVIRTFSECKADIAGYFLITFLHITGFSLAGTIIFGYRTHGYHKLGQSFYTLFFFILGDPNFQTLSQANTTLGPVFYVVVLITTQFIIMNFFIAILREAYEFAKTRASDQEWETLRYLYNSTLMKLGISDSKEA